MKKIKLSSNEMVTIALIISVIIISIIIAFIPEKTYAAKHILVDNELTAKIIIRKLDAGNDFCELVDDYSKDSTGNCGDVGEFKSGEMAEEFESAVKELDYNEYTEKPVKTEFGYHIILRKKSKKSEMKIKTIKVLLLSTSIFILISVVIINFKKIKRVIKNIITKKIKKINTEKLKTKAVTIIKNKQIYIAAIIVILIVTLIQNIPLNIENIKDSVVKIEVYDENGELVSNGSGFAAYEKNWIITNFHVIEGAKSIIILSDENKEYKVNEIIIFNKEEDLAILSTDGNLKPLKLGNGNNIKIKDKVTAIGSPMGEQNTISEGIISNADSKDEIRITAPISHGSSGGVLLNNKNKVIGITNAGYDEAQNLNFAINVNVLKKLYKAYKDEEYNEINSDNYESCIPNIVNHNTQNELSIRNKCTFSSHNNYTTSNLDTFFLATNEYEIFKSAMYKIGISGFNNNYKKFTENKKKEAANNFTYLLKYENCLTGETSKNTCELSKNIASWSKEQFILELDLLTRYELAILMVEIDNYLYSSDALINYLNQTNLGYEEKIILNKLFNQNDNRYNSEIINYFDNSNRINYNQEVELLQYLGMYVDVNGDVYW